MSARGPSLAAGAPIDLPVLLETRALVQANSGGGKSRTLRRLLEQTAPLVQQLVIDPEGEFATLREKYDYVIAAPRNADAVATPQTAALLARRLLESGVSAILDIYELKAHERQRFVRLFLESLINAPRSIWHPVLVVIDEAHTFAPQNGSAEALPAVVDLCTRGRKRGQCAVLATQRVSKLHKDAAAELINKLIGRTSQDVDVKRAADELGMTSRDATEQLRNLAPGEFFAFGPALTPQVRKVRIGDVETTHPKSGNRVMQAPPPSAKVRKKLAELEDLQKEAETEARTIDELRGQNAELRAKLTRAEKRAPDDGVPEAEVLRRIDQARTEAAAPLEQLLLQLRGVQRDLASIDAEGLAALRASRVPVSAKRKPWVALARAEKTEDTAAVPSGEVIIATGRKQHADLSGDAVRHRHDLSGPEQRIVDAIAWMNSIGVAEPEQTAIAFLAGYSGADNGAYKNPRGALNQRGLVRYVPGGRIALTDEGAVISTAPEACATSAELHARILAKLPGPERKILELVLAAHPASVTNAELSVAAGYSGPDNGAFKNPRGRLRTFGLVEYQGGGVRARDFLFPGGN